MKFINSFYILYILKSLFINTSCENFEAAHIIIRKGEFQLAYPLWVAPPRNKSVYEAEFSLPLPPWDKIYKFCPPRNNIKNPDPTLALELTYAERNSQPAVICHSLPKPVVVKVLNPEKFMDNWKNNIEWYVNGFKINTRKIIKDLNISSHKFDSSLRYESVSEGETVVPGYSVFYDTTIEQMIAAEYDLLPANEYDRDQSNNTPYNYLLMETPDLSNMDKFFENEKYTGVYQGEKPEELRSCEQLVQATLISPPHFIYWFHKRMVWMNINLIPMRAKYFAIHQKINTFLETVAKKVGKLKITSGVSGLGLTAEERKQRTYTNFENQLKIVIPDILWKVVEFKFKKEIYGVILVQINTFSEPGYRICKDVCNKYKWSIRGEDEENVAYCCDMTADALKNLEVPFLGLENRQSFDLTSWGFYNK